MKKADKFEITINIHKTICITKKMVAISIILIVLLALIISNCSPETIVDFIRLISNIVSMANAST